MGSNAPLDAVSMLFQFGIVGVFIWYSIQVNKAWQSTIESIASRFEAALKAHDEVFLRIITNTSTQGSQPDESK